ncbi:MAG: hypothetical protein HYZ48_02105 [Chlamydiales bacterium]|nr:hypothetical protein [Chlamydiales bacterium]
MTYHEHFVGKIQLQALIHSVIKPSEGIAKLLCPKKSMILKLIASGSIAATVHSGEANPLWVG